MKAKTTINFTPAQLETLKSLMLSVAYSSPKGVESNRIEFYRTEELQSFAKDLTDLLERAESVGLTTEGEVRRI